MASAITQIQKTILNADGTYTDLTGAGNVYTDSQFVQPYYYQWSEEDISADAAGRTADYAMVKLQQGTIEKLELKWHNLSTTDITTLLTAFDSEYLKITYLSPKAGTTVTKYFYKGNRAAPLYNATLNVWSELSFNLIQREMTSI